MHVYVELKLGKLWLYSENKLLLIILHVWHTFISMFVVIDLH